jgi:U3 small nucleolar ribonucleoprotein protein LCP5
MATITTAGTTEEKIADLSSVLETLTTCLTSASTSLPSSEDSDGASILPPTDGISLLDVKSEILLSYMQNLVFLILDQLHRVRNRDQGKVSNEDIVKKLIELRVYLDRGVRPLEGRLKYQIDKVVKAADDAERTSRPQSKSAVKKQRKAAAADVSDEEEDSEGSESDGSEEIDEMAYRPNISAFSKNMQKPERESKAQAKDNKQQPSDGIYRPPKIKPTALPTTESRERNRDRDRRSKKSSVIDEFVSTEMSSAPMAEPSIGSTIQRGGRKTISKQDRERDTERRTYEETNFVRLPKESKKERSKRQAGEGPRAGGFGGEEFRLLGEGADRIGRLTKRATGSSRDGALEKSRKRHFTEDGPRGDGASMGQSFDKRRRKVEGWKR